MMQRFWWGVAGLVLLWLLWPEAEIVHGPGVVAPQPPRQVEQSGEAFPFKDFLLKPLADFEVEARVLSREGYRFGREAELSPLDLALGWGRMSDESVLSEVSISQGGRFYHWRVDEFPIPRHEIETHSANMHLIPADRVVENILDKVRPGHVVRLRGRLVNASANDGWRWNSSLTRDDTGAGACELLYVEAAQIVP